MAPDLDSQDAEVAFRVLQDSFLEASDRCPSSLCETPYVFAGQAARVRIIGHGLADRIHQPFAHLQIDDAALKLPHLTVELWDQRDTRVLCRVGSMQEDCLASNPILTASPDGRFVFKQTRHSSVCFDRAEGRMVGCMSGAPLISLYERGRPLHGPLTLWHNDQDTPVIHAGLVSLNGHGVLFAGSSGSGKSTSSLVCVDAGFKYLSEDQTGLESSSNGSFLGHSLYNSAHVEANHLIRFPTLKPFAIKGRSPLENKFLILLSQVFPTRLEPVTEIKAVALPRVLQTEHSRIHRASKGETLKALAPSSLLVPRLSAGMQGFNRLVALVEKVPCFRLELGRKLNEIPCRVAELLDTAIQK